MTRSNLHVFQSEGLPSKDQRCPAEAPSSHPRCPLPLFGAKRRSCIRSIYRTASGTATQSTSSLRSAPAPADGAFAHRHAHAPRTCNRRSLSSRAASRTSSSSSSSRAAARSCTPSARRPGTRGWPWPRRRRRLACAARYSCPGALTRARGATSRHSARRSSSGARSTPRRSPPPRLPSRAKKTRQ
jgi:hypothetical protein